MMFLKTGVICWCCIRQLGDLFLGFISGLGLAVQCVVKIIRWTKVCINCINVFKCKKCHSFHFSFSNASLCFVKEFISIGISLFYDSFHKIA